VLSIDADDVVEDRRRFASCSRAVKLPYPTPCRAPDGLSRVDGCVRDLDAHVEDYSIPYLMGQFVMTVPSVLLELSEKYHRHDLQFFPGNVENLEIAEMDDVRLGKVRDSAQFAHTDSESDALQVYKGYLEMIKERPMKTSEMG
jgi:hypothetical protein